MPNYSTFGERRPTHSRTLARLKRFFVIDVCSIHLIARLLWQTLTRLFWVAFQISLQIHMLRPLRRDVQNPEPLSCEQISIPCSLYPIGSHRVQRHLKSNLYLWYELLKFLTLTCSPTTAVERSLCLAQVYLFTPPSIALPASKSRQASTLVSVWRFLHEKYIHEIVTCKPQSFKTHKLGTT